MNNTTLDSKLNQIRTNTYAATVRSSIADAIDQIREQVNALTPVSDNSTVSIEEYVTTLVDNAMGGYAETENVYNKTDANSTFVKKESIYSENDDSASNEKEGHIYSAEYIDSSFAKSGDVYSKTSSDSKFFEKTNVLISDDESEQKDSHVYSSGYIDSTFVKSSNLEDQISSAISNIQINNSGLTSTISTINDNISGLGTSISSISTQLNGLDSDVRGNSPSSVSNRLSSLEGSINGTGNDNGLVNKYSELSAGLDNVNSDMSDLENDVSYLNDYIEKEIILNGSNFPTYGFLRSSNYVSYNEGYKTSDYISICPGDTLVITQASFSIYYYMCFYDKDKQFTKSIKPNKLLSESTYITEIEVDDGDVFIRLSAKVPTDQTPDVDSSITIIKTKSNISKIIHEIKYEEKYKEKSYFNIPFSMTPDQYVTTGNGGIMGAPNPNSDPSRITLSNVNNGEPIPSLWKSNFIDVRGIKKIRLRTSLAGTNGVAAFFVGGRYKGINYYIPKSDDQTRLTYHVLDVPDGCNYFVFSCYLGGDKIQDSVKEALYNELDTNTYNELSLEALDIDQDYLKDYKTFLETSRMNYPPYEKLLSGSILCLGDSLTAGGVPTNFSTSGRTTYPAWLQILTGITTTSRAVSGSSPSSWWNDDDMSKDFSGFGSYIIWFGTNLGPENDPDPEFDDADLTAILNNTEEINYTETQYYQAIIYKIIKQVPTAKIFLGTVYATSGNDLNTINDKIRAFADLYPDNIVGICEMNDGSLYGPSKINLHGNVEFDVHFTNGGYFYLANKWLSEIRRCIRDNISLF